MTAAERAVMDALRSHGPLAVGPLAQHTHKSPTVLNRALRRLKKQGRVDLEPFGGVLVARRLP